VRRSTWEPRTVNAAANNRVPTADELSSFRAAATNSWGNCNGFKQQITGAFTGTTDEIIQWAAWKWGIDEDVVRALAVQETWWRMSDVGDGGLSYGITQIKRTVQLGTFPLSRDSTAFNLDYFGAFIRHYYEGCATWLNTVERGQQYAAGDLWGSLGAWYAGRWYTSAAQTYIESVRGRLTARTWAQPGF
jgi:hypothetical protein